MRNEQIKRFIFGLLSSISISCLKLWCAPWLGCKIRNSQLSVFQRSALLLLAPLEELDFPYSNSLLNPITKTIAFSSETKVPVVFFPDDVLRKWPPEKLARFTFWWAGQLPFLPFLTLQAPATQQFPNQSLSLLPKTCLSSWLRSTVLPSNHTQS